MRTKFAIVIVVITAAACGKSEQQKQAEQAAQATQQAAQQIAQGAQQMAQGAQSGAQGLAAGLQAMAQGMQQTGADGKPVPPVDFEKLVALLPDAAGWTKDKPKGGTHSAMGFSMSNAETTYRKGDTDMHLEITDAAFNNLFTMSFGAMMAMGYNERTTEGFKRATTIGGSPAYEEWTNDSKRGEVGIFVGKRFLVKGEASGVDNIDAIRNFVSQVDLAKLATTK